MKYSIKSKKLQVGILLSITALLCTAGVMMLIRYQQPQTVTLAGESQVLRERARDIEVKAPAEGASLDEKVAYYDRLVQAKRIIEDHKASVAAFEERLKLSSKGLDYRDYLHVALSYQYIGENKDALSALDQSEKLLPPDRPEEGFMRSEVLEDINKMRSELR